MRHNQTFVTVFMFVLIIGAGLIFANSKSKKSSNNNPTENSGTVAGVSTSDKGFEDGDAPGKESTSYTDKLAQYLRDHGVILYGAYWDQDTIDQKKLFGDSAGKIDYVECDRNGADANPDECIAKNVQTYPTWVYQDKQYRGIQTLAELAKIVDFSTNRTAE